MAVALEESLKVVTSVSPRSDFASYVPRDGLSLNFLLQQMSGAKLDGEPLKTMYDVEDYVLTLAKGWLCSFTELLKAHPSHSSAIVDKASYFVSFAYSTELETILSALEKFKRNKEIETREQDSDIFVWISIFSVNQHFGRSAAEKLNAPVVYPPGWFKNAFRGCIESTSNVLFVMSPLAKPVALERLWCIYELYLAISNKSCTLDIVLSEEDEQFLVSNLKKNTESIFKYISNVNTEKATPGGYGVIDGSIRDRLRKWFAQTTSRILASEKEQLKPDSEAYLELLLAVAKMLSENGRIEEAIPLSRECVDVSRRKYGTWHAGTALALSYLAASLTEQAKFEEARELFEEALAIRERVLGQDDPMTINTRSWLGDSLYWKADTVNAEPVLREVVKSRKRVQGTQHPSYALALNNLAELLSRQGKLREAEQLYREALEIQFEVLGDEHPAVGRSLSNLALLLKNQGKLEAAKPLYRRALAIHRKLYGNEHPAVAIDLNNLAMLLHLQGQTEEAKYMFLESLGIRRKYSGMSILRLLGAFTT